MKVIPTENFKAASSNHPYWHVTPADTAPLIIQQGFKAMPSDKGNGVFVSTNPYSAHGLIKSIERMNSFQTLEDVAKWFVQMGVSSLEAQKTLNDFNQWAKNKTPQHFYLYMLHRFHPSTKKIPRNEFLFQDIAKKFMGKQPVVMEGEMGIRPKKYRNNEPEAEQFVPEQHLHHLDRPRKMYNSSDEFRNERLWTKGVPK